MTRYTGGPDLSEYRPGPKVIDRTGQQYGDFVIVRYVPRSTWLCRCVHCGNEKWVRTYDLARGRIGRRCLHCQSATPRENEVFALVAQGKTSKEIARELVISWRTVQTHLTNLFTKYNVSNRTELALKYKAINE